MSEVDKDYELKVLKMVVNKYLDENLSNTEESFKKLEANLDQVVWDLATKIYSQSGHKVELSLVRDVVNSRIGAMKNQLSAEKKSRANQARRVAEEKARQATLEEAPQHDEIACVLGKFGGNESKAKIFIKARNAISKYLYVEENEVNEETTVFIWKWYKGGGWFSSTIPEEVRDFKPEEASSYRKVVTTERGGESDAVNIWMTLEEEFDIEISESEFDDLIGCTLREIVDYIAKKTLV